MTALPTFVEEAIPHEAGHILVGRTLGIPVVGLDHIVIRGEHNQILQGDFATRGMAPADPESVKYTPVAVLEAYISYVGGGLAGNIVSRIPPDQNALKKDRSDLKVVSAKTLEEAAESAKMVIEDNLATFEKLRTAIRESYIDLMKDENIAATRHHLLNANRLEEICPQNRTRFPQFWIVKGPN